MIVFLMSIFLWDSSLFILQTAQHSKDKVEELTSFSALLAILFALPALSYGLFIHENKIVNVIVLPSGVIS